MTVIRIPLTLAIIDGMCLRVGASYFTVPISAVKRSFRPEAGQIFLDSDGHEMIMERRQCCPVVRLGRLYHIEGAEDDIGQAVLMLVENDGHLYGLLADELLGVQQIVVKSVPSYIKKLTTATGIIGCTLLGDGSISLIIDPAKLGGLIFPEGGRRMDEEQLEEEDTQRDKYLTFTLEGEQYGIDIAVVMEIIGILPITKVPEVPDYVRGIINLRGKIIPVVDMRLRFRREFRAYTDRTCIIVIDIDGLLIELIIDGVSEVLSIPEDRVVSPPALRAARNRYIRGIGRLAEDKVVLLIDWQRLFSEQDEAQLTAASGADAAPEQPETATED